MSKLGQARNALLALATGHFVVDLQSSGLVLLVPIIQAQLHLDYAAAAAIITAQTVTSSVIQPLTGMLSDRRPIRQLLPLACLIAGLGTATVLFMPSYGLVLAVVIVTGLGSAIYHSLASLNANYVSSGAAKARGMSVFFAGGQYGYAAGPLLMVLFLRVFGNAGTLLTLVPAAIGAVAVLCFLPYFAHGRDWRPRTAQVAAASASKAERRHAVWGVTVIVLVICVRSIIQTGLITFIPLYYAPQGPNGSDYAALLLSVFVLAGATGTLFGGALADRFGRKPVLVVSMGVVFPLLMLFLNSSTGVVQVLSIGVAGASLVSAAALTVVMAQELMPNNIGLAAGLTLGLGFGAGGLGVIALGEIADAHGLPVAMHILALLPLLLVALTLLIPGGRARRQEDASTQPAASLSAR